MKKIFISVLLISFIAGCSNQNEEPNNELSGSPAIEVIVFDEKLQELSELQKSINELSDLEKNLEEINNINKEIEEIENLEAEVDTLEELSE